MLARTAVQPRVLVALIQCATIATESEEDVVINCVAISYAERKEGRISEKITSFVIIVGLYVRAVSVFGKKIRSGFQFFGVFQCGFAVFGPPLQPPPFAFFMKFQQLNVNKWPK